MANKRITPVHPGIYLKELLDELKISSIGSQRRLAFPPCG